MSTPRKRIRIFLLLSVGAAVCVASLRFIAQDAGNWRNAISLSYWSQRISGGDLYLEEVGLLRRGPRDQPIVTITIDDGPYETTSAEILDAFAEAGRPAAFFVVGEHVQKRPELIRRMIDEGHEVGNHTMTHPRLDELADPIKEVILCEEAVRDATGRDMTFFRPPGMRSTQVILRELKGRGYVTVDWNIAARDFTGMTPLGFQTLPSPDEITAEVLSKARNGTIILLHDTPATAQAMPAILHGLQRQGFRVVSLSEMLSSLPRPRYVVANPPATSQVVKAPTPPAPYKKPRTRSKGSSRGQDNPSQLMHGPDLHYLMGQEAVESA
jgi:peptidoglycan-N-acetylglucosamine deacetylase